MKKIYSPIFKKYGILALMLSILFSFISNSNLSAQTQVVTISTTGSGTWTAPCAVTSVTIEAWGGGGAGGGRTSNYIKGGGGGAGGTYVKSTLTVVPGNTYNLNVGTGGNGGYGDGPDGNSSWFSTTSTLYAKGGDGGARPNNTTVNGGVGSITGSVGTIKIAGANGGKGNTTIGGAGGSGGNTVGTGGAQRANEGNGNNGSQPGGGGGGAFIPDRSNHKGGNGADGQIIITYNGMANYCIPGFSNVEPITNVNFAGTGINNTSSPSLNAADYEIFCGITGAVSLGNTYPITVQGNTDGAWFDYFTVFIDWDGNGVLNNAGEVYQIGSVYNSTGTDGIKTNPFNITVPPGAKLGKTKMRIIKNYNNYENNPCRDNTFGQIEDYQIEVSGGCQQPTGAAITDGTNSSSTSLSVCLNTSVTLTQTGGTLGPNQNWKWYTGGCGGTGSTLVNTNSNPDGSYSFTPSAGTTTYYVRAEGGTCLTSGTCKSVTVVVNTNGTIAYTSGGQYLDICKGATLTNPVVYTVAGGASAASIVWSPSVPTGITSTYSPGLKTFTISGGAGQAGTFNYTITPGGNSPCTNTSISGSIKISEAPLTLNYTTNPAVYCSGGDITPNTPIVTGGSPTYYSVSPALPAGLSIDNITGIISGRPNTPTAINTYIVTATNGCGSTTKGLSITISLGDQAFNVTPAGVQPICSGNSVAVGLDNSISGVKYQLYLGVNPVAGALITGTGLAISFGNQSAAGVYTVKTTSSCATNMNGSVTINVTQQPTTTFSYLNYTHCKSGTTPAAIMAGSPTTGTFTSSPAGLVFADASTGIIDLEASSANVYTITYNVSAAGGCSFYSYTQTNKITIVNAANFYSVTGGGEFCSGTGGVPVGLENSQTGVSYQLYRDGSAVSPAQIIAGTGSPLDFGNQTIPGTYNVVATLGLCIQEMDDEAEITENPVPGNIKITPATATLCQGSIIPLTASLSSEIVVPSTASNSSNTSVAIPNNSASGAFRVLRITGIPTGATITGVSVNFRISHPNVGDLVINLKGPNGNVLNIANMIGGGGDNFGNGTSNTYVNNSSINNITTAVAPFNATPYSPQAAGAVAGATLVPGNVSNTTTFSGLYGATAGSANGNWILSVRDNVGGSNVGTLNNCEIVITYTNVNNPTPVTWSPATDLYTDPGGSIPYATGNSATTIYAKPSLPGNNIVYTATASNNGCSAIASTTIKVNPSPVITIKADYCNYPNVVRIIAKSSIPISSWLWNNGTTGGTPNNSNDTSFINVNVAGNYYVSAKAAGNSCPGTAVMSIAQELVINGNFELGKTGFESDYYYQADVAGNTELWDHNANGGTNGYGIGTNGQNYHSNFWGIDHTFGTGDGRFMIINGHGSLVTWKNENVTVLPNTTYYFSGWGMSLNKAGPFARLKFVIDGDGIYNDNFTANLVAGVNDNSNNGWQKFYGKWTSGPTTTSVNIYIENLETSLPGNDYALDDISFGTLSTFFNMTSDASTKVQTGLCLGKPITDITYEVGGDGNPPTIISGSLPAGVSTYWNGRNFRLNGTPTTAGNYTFTLKSSGCNPKTQVVTINVIPASNAGTFVGAPIISDCYGSSGTVAVTGAVGNLQWQTSPDNANWSNAANGVYNNLQSAMYYRVIAQNTGKCDVATSVSVKLGVKNLWTGKTNDSWNLGTNWSDETTPTTSCDNVLIPDVGAKPYPILTSGITSVKNIIIKNNASLTVNGNGKMQIAGAIKR